MACIYTEAIYCYGVKMVLRIEASIDHFVTYFAFAMHFILNNLAGY